MPVAPKKKKADAEVVKTTAPPAIPRERKAKRTGYLITAAVAAVVLIIIGVLYYQAYIAPFQRVIITVDDTHLRADYFLERTRLAGADPMSMTLALTNEVLIRKGAPQFGISVSPQDIDRELRRIAAGDADNISESAFSEWYRQQLARARVSDATYREVIETGLLGERLQAYLGERAATIVPQVHVSAIFVSTEDEANKVIERWEAGEDFAKLARELSIDDTLREKGGDLGWMPRGVAVFDAAAFGLEVGKISEPIPYVTDPKSPPAFYYILLVTEKADARQVDAQYVEVLKSRALEEWLNAEIGRHQINWNFDSKVYDWLKIQLAKTQPSGGQQPPGGQQ